MFKAVVDDVHGSASLLLHSHFVYTLPVAILRRDSIDNGVVGEVVRAAIGRSNRCSGSEGKHGRKLAAVSARLDSEHNEVTVDQGTVLLYGVIKTPHASSWIVEVQPRLLYVALSIGRLVFETRCERGRCGCHEQPLSDVYLHKSIYKYVYVFCVVCIHKATYI